MSLVCLESDVTLADFVDFRLQILTCPYGIDNLLLVFYQDELVKINPVQFSTVALPPIF